MLFFFYYIFIFWSFFFQSPKTLIFFFNDFLFILLLLCKIHSFVNTIAPVPICFRFSATQLLFSTSSTFRSAPRSCGGQTQPRSHGSRSSSSVTRPWPGTCLLFFVLKDRHVPVALSPLPVRLPPKHSAPNSQLLGVGWGCVVVVISQMAGDSGEWSAWVYPFEIRESVVLKRKWRRLQAVFDEKSLRVLLLLSTTVHKSLFSLSLTVIKLLLWRKCKLVLCILNCSQSQRKVLYYHRKSYFIIWQLRSMYKVICVQSVFRKYYFAIGIIYEIWFCKRVDICS